MAFDRGELTHCSISNSFINIKIHLLRSHSSIPGDENTSIALAPDFPTSVSASASKVAGIRAARLPQGFPYFVQPPKPPLFHHLFFLHLAHRRAGITHSNCSPSTETETVDSTFIAAGGIPFNDATTA